MRNNSRNEELSIGALGRPGGIAGLGRAFRREIRFYRGIHRDPRTPWPARVCLGLAAGYLAVPLDLIPDWIPVLGQLDDILIVPGLVWLALRLIPAPLLEEHKRKSREERAIPYSA